MDRMSLLLLCCKDGIGAVSVVEIKDVSHVPLMSLSRCDCSKDISYYLAACFHIKLLVSTKRAVLWILRIDLRQRRRVEVSELEGSLDLDDLVCLDYVANLDVVEVLDVETAVHAGENLLYVVFVAFE